MARKKGKTILKIKIKKVATGHHDHRSGAGVHLDRRFRRLRTRQRQLTTAIQ